jgi:hypothetical protein
METGWGHLGWSVGHSEGKGGESVVAIPMFLCGSPHLCRLRIEGLVPVSRYWTYRLHVGDYEPSKPSILLVTRAWLFPTTSLVFVGEKLGTNPRISQPACCGLCRERFFSGAVDLFKSVDDYAKGCHIRELPTGSIRQASVDWRREHTCHIGWVFSCRVYIDLNHRDSRIWVTACSWLPSSSDLLINVY